MLIKQDVIYNHADNDTASMALPSGHAASTRESWYLICFTNVISCHGSRAIKEHQTRKDQNLRHVSDCEH